MLALTLAVSVALGAAEARPEAWVVVSRRSGVAKPQALELGRMLTKALVERGVPAPTAVEDASSCAAKVPCLVDLAQKKGVSVLIAVEAGSALDDVVLHVEALSVEEFGKKLATFDFTGPAKDFNAGLKDKVEEFFAPAVRNVLGLGTVAKVEEKKPEPPPVAEVKPQPVPEEKKPEPAPVAAVETKASSGGGMTPLKVVGIAAMGVGAILLGTSAGLGVTAMGKTSERRTLCPDNMPCTNPKAFDLYQSAGGLQNAGLVTLGVGLALAAAGAVLFILDLGNDSSATVTPSASSDGMSFVLSATF